MTSPPAPDATGHAVPLPCARADGMPRRVGASGDDTDGEATRGVGRDVLFDPIARCYGAVVPLLWHVGLAGVESWLVAVTACADRVLDAGTGSGHWLTLVGRARARHTLVGLDSSAAALDLARRRSRDPAALWVRADLLRTPFRDATFDAVVCAWVLDTLVAAGPALAEFRRLLAPNGVVALVLRGSNTPVSAALERVSRYSVALARAVHERSPRQARVPEKLWRREPLLPELPALAARAGLDIVYLRAGSVVTRALLRATER